MQHATDDRGATDPVSDSQISWRKSSFSMSNGDCVEVAPLPSGHLAVRDSKDTSGPALSFTVDEWQTFVADLKNF